MALATPATLIERAQQAHHLQAYFDLISFPGDTAYPTGGTADFEAFVQEALGHNATVLAVIPAHSLTGATPAVYHVRYDAANDKLLVLDAALAEVADTTDLSGTTFQVLVVSQ